LTLGKEEMRAVGLSFLVPFLALAVAVFAHHMITTSRGAAAVAGSAVGALLCVTLSFSVANALKKEWRTWPRFVSTAFHILAAAFFFESLRSQDFSSTFKFVSLAAGASVAICGFRLLLRHEPKA
jgi:hypothetical protein